MSLKAVSMQNLTIINQNGNHYRVNFAFISKTDAYNFVSTCYKDGFKKIKFGDKEVNKKEFYLSKQAIPLDSVDLDKIVVSGKCKINETTYKYLCGYLNNDVIQPLCVILPQMNGYIKYFDNGGKNVTFVTDNEKVYDI